MVTKCSGLAMTCIRPSSFPRAIIALLSRLHNSHLMIARTPLITRVTTILIKSTPGMPLIRQP